MKLNFVTHGMTIKRQTTFGATGDRNIAVLTSWDKQQLKMYVKRFPVHWITA